MPLPNPDMDFVPFDVLTAEELDNFVANIESLSDGTGFDDNVMGTGTLISPYKFSAYASATTTLPGSTYTKIAFGTEEYDDNGDYDTANSRHTISVPGYYRYSATMQDSSGGNGEYHALAFYKNGTLFKTGASILSQAANINNISASPPPFKLVVGDYIEVYGFQNSGGGKTVASGQDKTYFGGYLVV